MSLTPGWFTRSATSSHMKSLRRKYLHSAWSSDMQYKSLQTTDNFKKSDTFKYLSTLILTSSGTPKRLAFNMPSLVKITLLAGCDKLFLNFRDRSFKLLNFAGIQLVVELTTYFEGWIPNVYPFVSGTKFDTIKLIIRKSSSGIKSSLHGYWMNLPSTKDIS